MMWVLRLLLLTTITALIVNVDGRRPRGSRNRSSTNMPLVKKEVGRQNSIASIESQKIRSPRATALKMQVSEKKKTRRKKLPKRHVEVSASTKLRVKPLNPLGGKRRRSRALPNEMNKVDGVAQKYSKKSNVASPATPPMRTGRPLISKKSNRRKRAFSTTTAQPMTTTSSTSTTANQSSIIESRIKGRKVRSCTDKTTGEVKKGRCKGRKRRALKSSTTTTTKSLSANTTKSLGTTLTPKSVTEKKKRRRRTAKSVSLIPIKINLPREPYCIVYFPSNGTAQNDKEACSKLINLSHFERREKDGCYFYAASTRKYKLASGPHRCDSTDRVAYRFLDKTKTKCVPIWRKYSGARRFSDPNCTLAGLMALTSFI
uniref:Uncharacterized protein n=1 Tax=Romanomermis culicivorax TaxID=13658 RepID=A0A915HMM0_ROMCU